MIPYIVITFTVLVMCFIIAGAFGTTRMLNRRRQMTCPDCHALLSVPKFSPFHRLKSELGMGSGQQPGFTLRCDLCSADYRFTNDLKLVGRIADKGSA